MIFLSFGRVVCKVGREVFRAVVHKFCGASS